MDMIKIASQIFMDHLSNQDMPMNMTIVGKGLKDLLPTEADGSLNLQALLSHFAMSSSLSGLADSWLSDGKNKPISTAQISELFGDDKLEKFSNTLGLEKRSAAQGLSEMIPDLVDKSSEGGILMSALSSSFSGKLKQSFADIFSRI